ncbi:MAG: T9SS type A sorting domain-containing protein [Bacteroidota bacterium]
MNNVLTIQVNTVTGIALYTADGKLMWQEQINAGTKTIDVNRYAKGTYF